MHIAIAYNKFAGKFKPDMLTGLRELLDTRGHKTSLVGTRDSDFLKELQVCDHLCILGGDGTLRDCIDAARSVSASPVFTVMPLGTINLVARERAYENNILAIADRIEASVEPTHHYSALMNENPFVACLSIGPDSYSVARVTKNTKKLLGRFAYVLALFQQMFAWKRVTLAVNIDGAATKAEAIYVLKSRYFAGQWQLCPNANITKPHVSVILLPTARRRDFLQFIASAAISSRLASKQWIYLTGTELQVDAASDTPIQADGDIAGSLPLQIRLEPEPLLFS